MLTKQFFEKVSGTETLKSTTYSKFKFDSRNRPVDERRVAQFVKDFNKGNFFMEEFPAVVTTNFVVLDGQHRLKACEQAGQPFYFRFAKDLEINHVTGIQKNAGWKTADYLHSYVQQGNQNYIILQKFVEKYKFSIGVALSILRGKVSNETGGGLMTSGFYTGNFKVVDEEKAHKWAKIINEIGELCPHIKSDRSFCGAMSIVLMHPDYSHKRMVEHMTNYNVLMKRQLKTSEYVKNLEEVYNYRMMSKNKVRFI